MPDTLTAAQPRSAEILDAVRSSFAEKGFDGASMQDLAKAGGMSVGNFYRYFPSKAAIIEALIARDLEAVGEDFARVITSPDPMQMLRDVLREHVEVKHCNEDFPLWAEITAIAQRRPEIGAACGRMESEVRRYLLTIFSHATGLPLAETERRFVTHADFVVMLVSASAVQPPDRRTGADELTAMVLRTINATLDEVARSDVKG
ncbi:MAG: TetR/AcrR family transcriptional regulator [Cereibacter changlensis]